MPMSLPERQEVDKLKVDAERLAAKLENQERLQALTEKALAEFQARIDAPKPARLKHGELPPPRTMREL